MQKILRQMVQHDAAGGMLLVAAALLAILMANTPLSYFYNNFLSLPVSIEIDSFSIKKPLLLWINDGLMAIFFFLIGLEVKREFIDGHLSSRDQVILPAIAALAGIAVPATIYLMLNYDDPIAVNGWAIPSATDIAFALGVFSLFGKRLPLSLKLFLLSVAIFDDIAAIVIIAIFYSQELSITSLFVGGAGICILFVLNRLKVPYQSIYILVGIIIWAAVLKSGVHATLAGFAIALFIPFHLKNDQGNSMLEQMEHGLQPWVAFFILPIFAFSNAGVSLLEIQLADLYNSVTIGIMLALFFGNQIGIFGICWIAVKLGLASLPKGTNWQQLYGVSLLCGIGFTMSLFIGSLAFEQYDESYLNNVKIGVLAGSILSAIAGSYVISRAPLTPTPSKDERVNAS